jgi:alpha-D-ribose 1-methylphosphonate 5-triphosphate synthase subunit PhnG
MASSETRGESTLQARRKAAMAVLAHSDAAEISGRLASLAVPEHQDLRGGENGLVMLRGRIGGDGAPFNIARRGAACDRRDRFRLYARP